MWISIAVIVVAVAWIGIQIASGVAILGLDHFVQREKAAGPYWFIIGLESFVLVIGLILTCMKLGWC